MFHQKCKLCGKTKGNHKANTLQCPTGMKTRIGYTSFSKDVFVPVKSRKNIKDQFFL